ncbi:MAG TPA: hypothetical protein QF624_00910 [Dehalococcoidia bacterium]|nr:hypothetical protein [Dehalococcoidia bacterium]
MPLIEDAEASLRWRVNVTDADLSGVAAIWLRDDIIEVARWATGHGVNQLDFSNSGLWAGALVAAINLPPMPAGSLECTLYFQGCELSVMLQTASIRGRVIEFVGNDSFPLQLA